MRRTCCPSKMTHVGKKSSRKVLKSATTRNRTRMNWTIAASHKASSRLHLASTWKTSSTAPSGIHSKLMHASTRSSMWRIVSLSSGPNHFQALLGLVKLKLKNYFRISILTFFNLNHLQLNLSLMEPEVNIRPNFPISHIYRYFVSRNKIAHKFSHLRNEICPATRQHDAILRAHTYWKILNSFEWAASNSLHCNAHASIDL